jgi:hypothetical protein
MQKMMHPFVNGDSGTHCKNQNSNNKTPEIHLLAVTERKPFVWGHFRPSQPVKQKDLIAGIHKRMYAFGQHGRTLGEEKGYEFGHCNQEISDKRSKNNFFSRRWCQLFLSSPMQSESQV